MQVDYTGRQTEVTPQLRDLAERKLHKLAKVLPRITSVKVILSSDKHRQIAEVGVHSSNLDLTAVEESNDLELSLSTVMDKLTRQAQRHVGKLRERKRGSARHSAAWSGVLGVPATPEEGEAEAPAPRPRVIRSRRFAIRSLTVEEAAQAVTSGAEEFVLFRDASTDRLNLLYRRRDGDLGLIEPEP